MPNNENNEAETHRMAGQAGVDGPGGRLGWQFDGTVNIPLIADRMAVRLWGLRLDKKRLHRQSLVSGSNFP